MKSHRTNSRNSWLIVITVLTAWGFSWCAPSSAFAAPPAGGTAADAERHQAQGLKHYNLGRFDESIVEFQKAYDLDPDPTLLFNIAQAHRQSGRLDRAIFFLKRYLQMAPKANDRREVERRIREMERALQDREEQPPRSPPPAPFVRPEVPPGPPPAPPPTGSAPVYRSGEATLSQEPVFSAPPAPPTPTPPPPGPPPPPVKEKPPELTLRLEGQGGLALPWMAGGRELGHPTLLAVMVSLAFVANLDDDGTTLDLGLMGGYSPFSYHTVRTNLAAYADLISLMAGTTLHLPVSSGFALEPALGLGVTWWRGLGPDNPFTKGGVGATGPIPMPSARVSFSLLWNISPVAYIGLAPTFDVSLTSQAVLSDVVPYVLRFGANAVISVGF